MPSALLTRKREKNKKATMSTFVCSVFPFFLSFSPHLLFIVSDAPTATATEIRTSINYAQLFIIHSLSHLLFQHNTTQLNSTQLNSTQFNSTQLNSDHLPLSFDISPILFLSSPSPFPCSQTTIRYSTNTCQPTISINTTRPSHQFAHPSTHPRAN
ncbi:MAG: hypothetical protein JOS17DRAFT_329005 [Linnemannia elongata]|nr:MAG: hypothetical protein JOS17DRAFT_329005 [Linnemannia elongata]